MRIAKLRFRVVFQQSSSERDEGGGLTPAVWGPVCECWADVLPASAREVWAAEQLKTQVDTVVTIRNRNDLRTGMRVVIEATDQVLRISALTIPDADRSWLKVMCVADKQRTQTKAGQDQ